MKKQVVVTGGAGFVGSHIADHFVVRGHDVAIVDNLSTGKRENVNPRCELFVADLEHARHVIAGADLVVHCASYADIRRNWLDEAERRAIERNNLEITRHMLEAVQSRATVLFTSTSSVYGSGDVAWKETDALPHRPESLYAAAKLGAEAMLAAYAHARGFRWRILRPVNVVGARMCRGVIVDFVRQMRSVGAIHALDDGSQRKAWVHVFDVAEAAEVLSEGETNGAYNVASGRRLSWWEIVDAMGVPRDLVTYTARRGGSVGDALDIHLDASKLAARGYVCQRDVMAGVGEALFDLGWHGWESSGRLEEAAT